MKCRPVEANTDDRKHSQKAITFFANLGTTRSEADSCTALSNSDTHEEATLNVSQLTFLVVLLPRANISSCTPNPQKPLRLTTSVFCVIITYFLNAKGKTEEVLHFNSVSLANFEEIEVRLVLMVGDSYRS